MLWTYRTSNRQIIIFKLTPHSDSIAQIPEEVSPTTMLGHNGTLKMYSFSPPSYPLHHGGNCSVFCPTTQCVSSGRGLLLGNKIQQLYMQSLEIIVLLHSLYSFFAHILSLSLSLSGNIESRKHQTVALDYHFLER